MQTVLASAVGVVVGLASSFLFWSWITWILRPKLHFAEEISHEVHQLPSGISLDRYSIRVSNAGRRPVVEPSIRATIKGRYPGKDRRAVWDVPVNSRGILQIGKGGHRTIFLRYEHISNFVKEALADEVLADVDGRRGDPLRRIMDCLEDCYLYLEVIGFDGLSGTRRYFSSKRFRVGDIVASGR